MLKKLLLSSLAVMIVFSLTGCIKLTKKSEQAPAVPLNRVGMFVSNNLNILIKILNIITIGIMVPTLIVSIFLMIVKLPLFQEHPLAFWFILGLSGLSAFVVFFVWRMLKL